MIKLDQIGFPHRSKNVAIKSCHTYRKDKNACYVFFSFHKSLDFDCPADGLCSNQGVCDVSNGNCICDAGFEGITCQGNYGKIVILPL